MGKKSEYIVRGERKSIRMAEPRGDGAAGVDLGINILASVVTSTGAWLLYRGSRAKEDFFYHSRKIAEVQSKADSAKKGGDNEEFIRLSRKKRRLFRKLVRRMAHLYWNLANHLVRGLWELGVSKIYLGYPHDIAQDRGNKLTSNMWSYRKLMDAIELKAQEYGIRVYEVLEYNTSNHCAIHGAEVTRGPEGRGHLPARAQTAQRSQWGPEHIEARRGLDAGNAQEAALLPRGPRRSSARQGGVTDETPPRGSPGGTPPF